MAVAIRTTDFPEGVGTNMYDGVQSEMDVKDNPPGTVATLKKHKVIPALLKPEEEKVWQKRFADLFKQR